MSPPLFIGVCVCTGTSPAISLVSPVAAQVWRRSVLHPPLLSLSSLFYFFSQPPAVKLAVFEWPPLYTRLFRQAREEARVCAGGDVRFFFSSFFHDICLSSFDYCYYCSRRGFGNVAHLFSFIFLSLLIFFFPLCLCFANCGAARRRLAVNFFFLSPLHTHAWIGKRSACVRRSFFSFPSFRATHRRGVEPPSVFFSIRSAAALLLLPLPPSRTARALMATISFFFPSLSFLLYGGSAPTSCWRRASLLALRSPVQFFFLLRRCCGTFPSTLCALRFFKSRAEGDAFCTWNR